MTTMSSPTSRRRCKQSVTGLSLLGGLFAGCLSLPPAQAQDAASGSSIYDSACAHCHGVDGRGAQIGPSIVPMVNEEDDAALAAFLRSGVPDRGMPPAAVSEAQMPALLAHMRFLASTEPEAVPVPVAEVPDNRVVENYQAVDDAALADPPPGDWLSFSRGLDAQRFSPLDQINADNVAQLGLAWARGLPSGLTYTIPLVHDGVLYWATPDANLLALDATTGDLIWEYRRVYEGRAQNRAKTLAIHEDLLFFTAPDALIAVDARSGALRWEAALDGRGPSGGVIVAKGKVISSGNCIRGPRDSCHIAAHDARTGELLWRFNTVQAPGDAPGGDTWAGVPLEERLASPWGLPGSYDPELDLIYWGIANPMPNTRRQRHGGDEAADALPLDAPVDLYSNSTVALDPDSGELVWYYQHLPGDDWDLDMNEERILLSTPVNPDPEHVRWINPNVTPGETRELVVNVGEGGGLWALDRRNGEFLWATPFPFDVENFFLEDIDVETGITRINSQLILNGPGENRLICYWNTRSFWPSAYHPGKNALYVPYIRNCLDMTAASPATDSEPATPERRTGAAEPGVSADELNGVARINMETGETTHWPTGLAPTNVGMLVTAGNLVFYGDLAHHYQAMDADTGEVLWETSLGGPISMSNISYAVDGRQYIAVIAGETGSRHSLAGVASPMPLNLPEATGQAALYVFALPEENNE